MCFFLLHRLFRFSLPVRCNMLCVRSQSRIYTPRLAKLYNLTYFVLFRLLHSIPIHVRRTIARGMRHTHTHADSFSRHRVQDDTRLQKCVCVHINTIVSFRFIRSYGSIALTVPRYDCYYFQLASNVVRKIVRDIQSKWIWNCSVRKKK